MDHSTSFLYPFQAEDVAKLRDRKSVLIANEMGTGKTYEAIALDLLHRDEGKGPTLVIAPLTVLPMWEDHYKELAPHLRTIVIDPRKRGDFLAALKKQSADVFILHWDVLRIIKKELQGIWFLHIIADEVHRAKNRKAQQTRALKLLKAAYRSGLSGTPVINRPHDLWSILHWLYPREWTSYWRFYESFVDYELIYPQGYHKVLGPKNEKELLRTIRPYYTRRKKKDVLQDLPDKYYTKLWVELLPKQRKAYDEMKKDMITWLSTQEETTLPLVAPVVIAQLIRLQQLAAAYVSFDEEYNTILSEPSAKLDVLMQILEDNPDEQVVIFTQFKQLVRLACERFTRAGIPFSIITGDIKAKDRRTAVADFQNCKTRVFIGTIGAGGEGITLTAASTVIFLDRDWSPARNAQAEDRLHRIGQKEAVQVVDIMAKNSIDIARFKKLEMKKDWIRRILGD